MSMDLNGPLPPVTAHGKFLSRAGSKFFLKAMRLEHSVRAADFNGKIELRARLEELRAGRTTAIIVTADEADAVVDIAAATGLHTVIEIPFLADRLVDRTGLKAVRAELARIARHFVNRRGLIGFLLSPAISGEWLRTAGLSRMRSRLAKLVRYLKALSGGNLVAVRHHPSTRALAMVDEDLLYTTAPSLSGQELINYIVSLHNMAESRPVVVELEADCGDPDERIGCAFAAGVAGVVAPAFKAPPRTDALAMIALDPGKVLPFVALNGTCPPALAQPPMVSVVICAYNAERTMEACLKSLRELDYPNYEVVVVDDGSRDRTAEISARFPEFRLIRQPNKGLSVARNVGMQAARGEIIAYTDSDCVVDPHWLRFVVGAMVANGFDGCGGPNYAPHEAGRIEACVSASPGAPCQVLTAEDRAEHLAGCNMVFRKSVLQHLGGFDPQFTAAGDDVDICWRALDAGFVLGFCPAAFVWHFRRNTVKAYYNQQRGYGKAEAMLYLKYPERFNALGQVMWRGRIPGLARTMPGGSRNLISWVKTSSGFFQTIYEPPMGLLSFLPQTLEWNALFVAMAVVSLTVGFPVAPALAMLALGPIWALYYAWKAPLEKCHESFGSRLVVAFLAYTGPMFRTITRYRYRLAGALSARAGEEPMPRQRPTLALRERAVRLSYWSVNTPRDALVERLVKLFSRAGMPVRVDSGWNDYDLEVQADSWARLRIRTADEEHAGGKYKSLVQAQVRFSLMGKVILGLSAAALAVAVLWRAPSIDLVLGGLALVGASLALSEGLNAGRLGYWVIEQAAGELGLIPLGKPTAAAPQPAIVPAANPRTEMVAEKRMDS